jgi:hypothetical protein
MAHDGVMPVRQEAQIVALSGSAVRLTIRYDPNEGSRSAYFMSSGSNSQFAASLVASEASRGGKGDASAQTAAILQGALHFRGKRPELSC